MIEVDFSAVSGRMDGGVDLLQFVEHGNIAQTAWSPPASGPSAARVRGGIQELHGETSAASDH